MIRIESLRKSFVQGRGRRARRVVAIDAVDWEAADGAITGLLGPNGAGKTTTLRILAGLERADAGRAWVDTIEVGQSPREAQQRLGVLADARGLYPRLTARENIAYFARLRGVPVDVATARIAALARDLEMTALLDRRTEGFSQGERMKTALARALVHDPSHLVLDEPTNGLDVVATRALRDMLRRLRDESGTCIVLATHIMQEVERLCDRVVVMAAGRTVAAGTVASVCAQCAADDFEEAFVRLAFGGAAAAARDAGS